MSQLRTRDSKTRSPLPKLRRAPLANDEEGTSGFYTMEVIEADDADIFVAGFNRPLRPEPQTEEERSSNPEDEGSNPSGASTWEQQELFPTAS